MLKPKEQLDDVVGESRSASDGARGAASSAESFPPVASNESIDGAGPVGADVVDDDFAEWDDYLPEGILISEECQQELQRELEIYLAELVEEVGEPTPEEMARAEAWWRPIDQHLTKGGTR